MQPAIFLDRDGVIIENLPTYVRSWEDVEIYPQAFKALALLASSPYKIIVITNQSAVGRGIITLDTVIKINQRLESKIVEQGGRIDSFFVCPHAPEDGCDCRKPKPGLLLQAKDQFSLDLSRSLLIGDAISDLEAGKAAGIGKTILLRSGRGANQLTLPQTETLRPFFVYPDLLSAILEELPYFGDQVKRDPTR